MLRPRRRLRYRAPPIPAVPPRVAPWVWVLFGMVMGLLILIGFFFSPAH